MSITRINTNVDALMAGNNLRKLEFNMGKTMNRLSTGLRINTAADDPSGMGIANSFKSQLSGTRAATQNAEDTLSMMNIVDTVLSEISDIMIRMRDLAVRAATDATVTTAQRANMETEVTSLKAEITRKQSAISFNSKILFNGGLSGGHGSAQVQLGPDNIAAHRFSINIPTLTATGIAGGMSFNNGMHISQATSAQVAIDIMNSAISSLGTTMTSIGSMEQEIERKITELQATEVNTAAALSRIQDADMAGEITQFAKQQIISQAATAMIAQANAQPQAILMLLGV
jgi:flagellin